MNELDKLEMDKLIEEEMYKMMKENISGSLDEEKDLLHLNNLILMNIFVELKELNRIIRIVVRG